MGTLSALRSPAELRPARRTEDFLWEPTVPVGFIRDMIQASLERGRDVRPLLAAHDLDVDSLASADTLVSAHVYSDVLASIMRVQGDAFAGFLSSPVPLRAFPLLCYGLVGCRTIDEVLAYANAFYGMFCDDLRWDLHRGSDGMRVEITIRRALATEYRFVSHSTLLMTLRLFGWLYGEDIRPLSVGYPFPARPWDARLEYLFGCPIDHGSRSSAFTVSRDYDDVELSCTRDQITQMLRSTRSLFFMSRWAPPLTQRVRKLILAHRATGWLSVGDVAAALELSPNRLWRLLKQEGSSFLEIRDQLKRDWAITLVEGGDRTVEGIAEILGYGDVSAFRKAFRKWTGMQPGVARANAIARSRAHLERVRRR